MVREAQEVLEVLVVQAVLVARVDQEAMEVLVAQADREAMEVLVAPAPAALESLAD